MWGRKPKCPVRVEEQLWIEESLDWFVDEFGEEVLRRPVVVPEWSYFPAGYSGSEDDVRAVFASVCARVALVATIAHELGHERLLGESRIDASRRDGEPLTDLFSVFFGFGIFSANAAFEFRSSDRSYQTSKLGYLTEAMYGYALARYAWLRGETSPAWAAHLDTNPRTYLKDGLRFLASV
jgi:hypothetical protein